MQIGSRLDTNGYKTVKSKIFWIQGGYIWIRVHDFLDAMWIQVDSGWIQVVSKKRKSIKKTAKVHDFFGYKLDSEVTTNRSRPVGVDTEKILFIK